MEYSRALASDNWPDTMGTIIESEVQKETHTHTDISRRDTDTYQPVIRYNYSVDGYQYSSDRIIFGDTTYVLAFWKAHDYVDEFPRG